MADNVQQWSIEKVLTCMKRIVYPEVLPTFSKEEIDGMNYKETFYGEKKVMDFLKLIFEKSKGTLDIYGDINDMIWNVDKVEQIPEFVLFSSDKEAKISKNCCLLYPCYGYTDIYEKHNYLPRSTTWISAFKFTANKVISYEKDEIVQLFYLYWWTAFLNKLFGNSKETFDLIPTDSHFQLMTDLQTCFRLTHDSVDVKVSLTMEKFEKFSEYFDEKDKEVFNHALSNITKEEEKKHILATCFFLTENTKKIVNKHIELLTPFSKLTTPPKTPRKPVIRLICGMSYAMFLTKEVKDAMEIILKNSVAGLPSLDITVENKEERRLGIVHATSVAVFLEQIKLLRFKPQDFIILQDPYNVDFRNIAFPIMSAYGTHCIPALDAFDNIIYYLAVILKIFQRSNDENLQNVFNWIEKIVKELFVSKTVIYLIEIWKIDEIIDEARRKFRNYPTEPEYKVPSKEFYNKNDVFREFLGLTKNLEIDKKQFLLKAKEIRDAMFKTKNPITIKNIYHGYSQIVRHFLQEKYEKVNRFIENQKELSHFESVNFSIFKEEPKSEPERQENAMEPSCSTGNAENQNEQLREEVEKLRIDENQMKEQLEEEQAWLKTAEGSSENEIQHLREKLEKSQGAKTRPEEGLKALEQNYLEEIRSLKKVQEKAENDSILLKGDLERENEELKQKVESLMLENEKLQADNSKNTEFQQNIKEHSKTLEKEHSDLVDIARSRLDRLSSNNPESNNLEEAKNDVMKMKDCVHEYQENVEKEFEKLEK